MRVFCHKEMQSGCIWLCMYILFPAANLPVSLQADQIVHTLPILTAQLLHHVRS